LCHVREHAPDTAETARTSSRLRESGTTATLGNLQLTWTPVTGPYDRAGNALPTTARNEAGTSDRDF